jgi:hypothetical protein
MSINNKFLALSLLLFLGSWPGMAKQVYLGDPLDKTTLLEW